MTETMIAELISHLYARGVRLRVEGDRLMCDAPKGVLTSELQEQIRARKPEILSFLRSVDGDGVRSPSIPIISRENGLPLGMVQERMWLLDRLEPGTTVYNLPGAWRLRGELDLDAFSTALRTVVERHEIMRTRIDWLGDSPVQIVEEDVPLDLPLIDLQDVDPEQRREELLRRLEAESVRLFDLQRAPLFRSQLYRLGHDDHVFFFMPHHVIWDGWSFDLLLTELSSLYEAFAKGRPDPLPPLPVQYGDYVRWHRERMQGPELERQLEYWRQRLGGDLPMLRLPTDHPRPPVMSQRGIRRLLDLDGPLIDAIREIGRRENATLFMVLIAAYKTLLYRYSGQTDLIVGVPIQARLVPEAQQLIGAFVNTLVLRSTVEPEQTFREFLRHVREVCVGAYSHQDVPFERLVEEFQPRRTVSHTAIYQTLVTFQDITNRPRTFGDLTVEQVHVPTHTAPTDVLFGFMVDRAGTLGVFDFNADLFEPETMDRMVATFTRLLREIASDPDRSISTLPILSAEDRDQLLSRFNDTVQPLPDPPTPVEMIEQQCLATPDREAVRVGAVGLTYRDLDARASEIADALVAAGVSPGEFVAINLPRSADLVPAVLGVWRAGAAYVPIDPDHPPNRISHVLADSGASAMLTVSELTDVVPGGFAGTTVLLDVPLDDLSESADRLRPGNPEPDHIAYVLYTSGSTGLPKGVSVPHRAVANFLGSMAKEPGFGSEDVLLAVTTLAFDISVLELVLPLTVGGRVVIAPAEDTRDAGALSELISQASPTVMQATPSTWRMLFDGGWEGEPDLKVLSGGEALSPQLASQLLGTVSEVWNMYGPTETTVWSTCGRVHEDDDRITVGRPIANTRIYVLDVHGGLLPIGVPGEACIGGAGLAVGYLNAPEVTHEKFVKNPVPDATDDVVYRTGDLVRWLPDGRLEHLGRMDRQMKIHGFRVEPGEVEATLESLPEISQAVVLLKDDGVDKRLVSYVVFEVGSALTATEVRRALASTLPPHMIPGLVVPLDELPLTPNGKVDVAALPDPLINTGGSRTYEPPATEMEAVLARVWSELLGGEEVGRNDNFFEVGGNSLLAIRAVAVIEEEVGSRIDPRTFFFQTLGQIASGVEGGVEAHA